MAYQGNVRNNFTSEQESIHQEGPTTVSKRPQTSHGRGRNKNINQNDGVKRREEKHAGLGETSKDIWSPEEEEDVSKKQILMEKKQAMIDNSNFQRDNFSDPSFNSSNF